VLGDCGAFTYWREAVPPYRTEDVLASYQQLGFDLGVSIDHLIFAELVAEQQRRWEITMANAEEFLRLHRTQGYRFTPVGVAQGWDPRSYRRAVEGLVQMGYRHIALGGLVRTPTTAVLKILHGLVDVFPPGLQVHLFGVNRPEFAPEFVRLGVTSFDSASRLRRAWMDGRRNYFLGEDTFTAIRVPAAPQLARKRDADEAEIRRLEQDTLAHLRAYDRGAASLEATYAAVAAYAHAAGDESARVERDYARTLRERPWKRCPCAICRAIGVDVMIFRGNNRNRRRGFHNTWQLYQQLQAGLPPVTPTESPSRLASR